uniref:Mediator of RNA polymerase II transcription subunit 31 n=1 Tax=Ditylum brightwellii TaxID=49249 RepID=A0A7S1ZKB5_9STRA
MDISPPTPLASNTKADTPPPPAPLPSENSTPTTAKTTTELPPNRFELELEFIQCLASPAYLHHLAESNVLSSPSFLSYLRYLRYWKRPEYVRFIIYPHCLYFLDLILENETFRREMGNVGFRNFVHEQQFYSWQFRSERLYGRGAHKAVLPQVMGGGNEGGAVVDNGAVEEKNVDQTEARMSLGSSGSSA